jgi:hypothetical protein
MPVVFIDGAVGVRLERVSVIEDLTHAPEFNAGNPLRIFDARGAHVQDSEFTLLGGCGQHWPGNVPLSVHNSSDVAVLGSRFTSSCQGYCLTSTVRLVVADCVITSVGDVSQGSGFGTDNGAPYTAEHFYFGNNSDTGNVAAQMRWETMTFDGASGYYNGTVVAVAPRAGGRSALTLAVPPRCVKPLASGCLFAGMSLQAMRGLGAGQWRRIVGVEADGVTVVVEAPLDPPPALGVDGAMNATFVSITGMQGQATFEGNTWVNGTTIQTYGGSIDLVLAGNVASELFTGLFMNTTQVAAGIRLFGHRYQGGYEANWGALLDRNNFSCVTDFRLYADEPYPGDLAGIAFLMGHTVRRNAIGATNLSINNLHDGVVEHNAFVGAACALAPARPAGVVNINASSDGVVVRDNGAAGGETV